MHRQGISLLSLLLGLALPLYLPTLLTGTALVVLGLTIVFLACLPFCRFLAVFCIALIWSTLHLQQLIERQLPKTWEGEDLTVSIVIRSTPETRGENQRFLAEIIHSTNPDFQWRDRLRLSWYKAPELNVGQHWDLQVRLKRPRGFVNGEGFDYQAWLISNRIFASGYVRRNSQTPQLLKTQSFFFFETLRTQLANTLFANSEIKSQRFMRALLLGDKSEIRQQDWQVLQTTGTLHLMAISGLHVGLIASFGFILGLLLRLLAVGSFGTRPIFFLLPALVSVFLAWIYAGLSGFAVPTQRAFLFVLFINLAILLGRRVNLFYLLGFCAIVLAALDPFVFLAPGFYLSFAAVLVLFSAFQGRIQTRKPLAVLHAVVVFLRAQWVIFIALMFPLSLLNMPISLVGLAANAVAIPLITFFIVPLLFISALTISISPGFTTHLLKLNDMLLNTLWWLLEKLASYEFASFYSTFNGWMALLALLLAIILIFLPRYFRWHFLFVPLLLVAFASHKPPGDALRIKVLDVGQGLAVYVEWHSGNLLYDTGARFSEDFDVGARVIVPWLRSQGVNTLDFLVVSHGDNDHAGGLKAIQQSLNVSRLIYGPSVQPEASQALQTQCERGQLINKGLLQIEVLWPEIKGPGSENSSSNNSSCVLLLQHDSFTLLLSGDIEKEVEYRLLADNALPVTLSALVAPHHGSRSSSTQAFIEHLQAETVLFSAGYRNRYSHPNAQVLRRYEEAGSKVLRTDLQGALEYRSGEGWRAARLKSRRAWYD